MEKLGRTRFQSLSGFQVRCNANNNAEKFFIDLFQSLSGFQVRCNSIMAFIFKRNTPQLAAAGIKGMRIQFRLRSAWPGSNFMRQRLGCPAACGVGALPRRFTLVSRSSEFQSLSGFQVRCNHAISTQVLAEKMVSIPIGFSSSLQPWRDCFMNSIVEAFQSLSGFQVRCNAAMNLHSYSWATVSIPIGFSSSLQPVAGFSFDRVKWSFNPYRVFKFVATLVSFERRIPQLWVSIPIGFSSSLQL